MAKFKVGDKVRVIHDKVFGDNDEAIGCVGVVDDVVDEIEDYPYYVVFEGGVPACFYCEDELELIAEGGDN
jgi:hypothetical protein